jgi:hypothetical protein
MNVFNKMKMLAAVGGLFATSLLTAAQAATVSLSGYTPLFYGIDYATAEIRGTGVGAGNGTTQRSEAYVLRIDLNADGIGFTTTPHSGSLETISQTTTQFLQASGAQVAINTAFFSPCGCSTTTADPKSLSGLHVSNGTVVSTDESGYPSILFGVGNQVSMAAGGQANLAGVSNAVSGNGFVVQGGVNVAPTASSSFNNTNPRSLIGIDQTARWLYLVAVDGRQSGYSDGVSLSEEAQLLLTLGVWNGINLDGGGSTAMAVEGAGGDPVLVNRPSGGSQRYDGANLGVLAYAVDYVPPAPVPLPGAVWLLGSGIAGLAAMRRRKATAAA